MTYLTGFTLVLGLLAPLQDPGEVLRIRVADLPVAESPWAGRWEEPGAWPLELRSAYGRALREDTLGDRLAAFATLVELLQDYPDFPPALHHLGVVCFRLRRHGDAIEALGRFLEQAPEHVDRTRAMGHSLYSLGRHREALDHYDRVISARPDLVEARFGRALALHRLGRTDSSLAALDDVREREPDHGEAAYWRARIGFDEELVEDAASLEGARRAVALAPHDPRAAHLLAEVLLILEAGPEAEAARARAAHLSAVAQQRRALDERLLVRPKDASLLEARATAARSVGDLDAARADLVRLSRVALESGDIELSRRWSAEANELR